MRRQRYSKRPVEPVVAQDGLTRFLAAVASCSDSGSGSDLSAIVKATGLPWAKAATVAGRLRRNGCLASLPHGRLILSDRGRAVIQQA